MQRSSGDATFPKNISESRPAMVLIFKDYILCHFEKRNYIILKKFKTAHLIQTYMRICFREKGSTGTVIHPLNAIS